MKFKIGVFGSAVTESSGTLAHCAQVIGEKIAQGKNIIITGACEGLPMEAVKRAKSFDGFSIGYTAVTKKSDHEKLMGTSLSFYDELELIPDNYKHKNDINICRKYRNVSSVSGCDICIFISGRWGTLNEFAIAHDMGKIIGVLTGQGKFSSQVKSLLDFFGKSTSAKIIFNDNPEELYNSVIENAAKRYKDIEV